MNTFSKSYASLGGCVAGKKQVIEYIKHTARPFIFSASLPPAQIAAAHEALNILKAEPWRITRVQDISKTLRKRYKQLPHVEIYDCNNQIIPIIPLKTGSIAQTLYMGKLLLEAGVYVNPVLPPAVKDGSCLLRTSYTATQSPEILDEAVAIIAEVFAYAAKNPLPQEILEKEI